MPPAPSIANSVTVRLTLPARATAVSEMTGVIEAAGGVLEDVRGVKRRYWVPTTS